MVPYRLHFYYNYINWTVVFISIIKIKQNMPKFLLFVVITVTVIDTVSLRKLEYYYSNIKGTTYNRCNDSPVKDGRRTVTQTEIAEP